jgi:hypothetical protein
MPQKFRVSLKVREFELEIEGSRNDVPLIAQAIGQQMTGLLSPAANIVDGEIIEDKKVFPEQDNLLRTRKKRSGKSSSVTSSSRHISGDDVEAVALEWVHDPSKWGTPEQSWNTTKKSIWLLFVTSKNLDISELSGKQVAATFNKHFRQSGEVKTSRVNRDLGVLKTKNKPPFIGENTSQTPSKWYLTQEGEKYAQELVDQALGQR